MQTLDANDRPSANEVIDSELLSLEQYGVHKGGERCDHDGDGDDEAGEDGDISAWIDSTLYRVPVIWTGDPDVLRRQTLSPTSAMDPRVKKSSISVGIILESHSDECSTGDANGVYLISGYAASDEFWGNFASQWATILKEPPAFPPYHTNTWKDRDWLTAHGLSLESAEWKKAQLQSWIIDSSPRLGFTATIQAQHYREEIKAKLNRPRRRKLRFTRVPYYFVLEHFLKLIVSEVLGLNRCASPDWEHVERINFFVHAQQDVTADAVGLFDRWKQSASPEIRSIMGFLLPVPLHDYPSIQAADMLADQRLTQYLNEPAIFSGKMEVPPLCVPGIMNPCSRTTFANRHWKRQELIDMREKARAVCPDDWI